MNNKKYYLDLSLVIDTSNISQSEEDNIVIVKEINGQTIRLELPAFEGTAKRFISEDVSDHYWNATICKDSKGGEGFWLREKVHNIESGLSLVLKKTEQLFLPH